MLVLHDFTILPYYSITLARIASKCNTHTSNALPEVQITLQSTSKNGTTILWSNRMKHHTAYRPIRIQFIFVHVRLFFFKHLSELYVDAFVRNIHQQMLVRLVKRGKTHSTADTVCYEAYLRTVIHMQSNCNTVTCTTGDSLWARISFPSLVLSSGFRFVLLVQFPFHFIPSVLASSVIQFHLIVLLLPLVGCSISFVKSVFSGRTVYRLTCKKCILASLINIWRYLSLIFHFLFLFR